MAKEGSSATVLLCWCGDLLAPLLDEGGGKRSHVRGKGTTRPLHGPGVQPRFHLSATSTGPLHQPVPSTGLSFALCEALLWHLEPLSVGMAHYALALP